MPVDMTAFKAAETRLENDEKPPAGLYDARVTQCEMFDSKVGETWLKLGWVITSQTHTGHMWESMHGFREGTMIAMTKQTLKTLGVNIDVSSQEELEDQLDQVVGKHFTVEVTAKGFTNLKAQASAPLPKPDIPIPGPKSNGDDPSGSIPF